MTTRTSSGTVSTRLLLVGTAILLLMIWFGASAWANQESRVSCPFELHAISVEDVDNNKDPDLIITGLFAISVEDVDNNKDPDLIVTCHCCTVSTGFGAGSSTLALNGDFSQVVAGPNNWVWPQDWDISWQTNGTGFSQETVRVTVEEEHGDDEDVLVLGTFAGAYYHEAWPAGSSSSSLVSARFEQQIPSTVLSFDVLGGGMHTILANEASASYSLVLTVNREL